MNATGLFVQTFKWNLFHENIIMIHTLAPVEQSKRAILIYAKFKSKSSIKNYQDLLRSLVRHLEPCTGEYTNLQTSHQLITVDGLQESGM